MHVLCEKPMALNVVECDRMVAAAEEAGQGPPDRPLHPVLARVRRDPRSDPVRTVWPAVAASFRRFSSIPTWSPDNWFADEKRSGGQPLDLHIHDSDYVHHVFGLPAAVSSTADVPQTYISTQYHYPDGPAVVAESTWRMAPAFGFEMSFIIVLERATIVYDCTRTPAFRVCPADGAGVHARGPPR